MLLQKTLLNIEGMGRDIYPDLDLWQTAKPFLESWMRDRIGPMGLLRRLHKESPRLLDALPGLPHRLLDALEQQEHLVKATEQNTKNHVWLMQKLDRDRKRRSRWLALGLALAAAAISFLPESGTTVALMLLALAAVFSMVG